MSKDSQERELEREREHLEREFSELSEKHRVLDAVFRWQVNAGLLIDYWDGEVWKEDETCDLLPVSTERFRQLTIDVIRTCHSIMPFVDTTPLVEFCQAVEAYVATISGSPGINTELTARFPEAAKLSVSNTLPGSKPGHLPLLPFPRAFAVIDRLIIFINVESIRPQRVTVVCVNLSTNTVSIADQKQAYKVQPHWALMLNMLVENKEAGKPYTTGKSLRTLPCCQGKKIDREIKGLKERVPPLEEILLSNNQGYYLDR